MNKLIKFMDKNDLPGGVLREFVAKKLWHASLQASIIQLNTIELKRRRLKALQMMIMKKIEEEENDNCA